MSRSWLHLADDARRAIEFIPIPRRFLHLPTCRIVFGQWVLVGRIRKVG